MQTVTGVQCELCPKLPQQTVHLGQLDVASKPGQPGSSGFTGSIVVCVVSNQRRPPLGSAAAEDMERVT